MGRWDFHRFDHCEGLAAVNLRPTVATAGSAGASILRREVEGSIVTMSSQMGTVGFPGRTAYCATRHAVEGVTKAPAVGSAAEGDRADAVSSTPVETSMSGDAPPSTTGHILGIDGGWTAR